ncbi:hypothetical protein GCM10025778_13590 [Paeniglutamicibacter antarcticus]|uniref:Uncharacterized protein n=1 Tax=Paeniglutamicibacter antarcticus TaxID=494023 RepID=A0ABP9TK89_9MICC
MEPCGPCRVLGIGGFQDPPEPGRHLVLRADGDVAKFVPRGPVGTGDGRSPLFRTAVWRGTRCCALSPGLQAALRCRGRRHTANLAVFATSLALRYRGWNLLTEAIVTSVPVVVIDAFATTPHGLGPLAGGVVGGLGAGVLF